MRFYRKNPLIRVDAEFKKELMKLSNLNGYTYTRTTRELIPMIREVRIKNENNIFKKYEPNFKKIIYCYGLFAMLVYYFVGIYQVI